MTIQLPLPYPDELFYSVLARYHVRAGNTSHEATLQELFGSRSASASVEFPCRLNALLSRLPLGYSLTVAEIVEKHSLFPLYRLFVSPERAERALDWMHDGQGSKVYSTLGMTGTLLRNVRYLRFCPECFRRDLETYGEAYWHRGHQVPGVSVCPKHRVMLHDSCVLFRGPRYLLYCPTDFTCRIRSSDSDRYPDLLEPMVQLSQDMEYILNGQFPARSVGWFQDKCSLWLMKRGYMTSSGVLRHERLKRDFVTAYGYQFLENIQCKVAMDKPDWLTYLVRRRGYSSSPIRHLLVMRFLCGSAERFISKEDEEYKPFGNGPWVCINGAADHFGQRVITHLEFDRSDRTKTVIGRFRCSCGLVYTREIPRDGDSEPGPIFVRAWGAVWHQKLQELLDQGSSTADIANQLHVHPTTIRRHIRMLRRNKSYEPNQGAPAERSSAIRERYRARWIALMASNPGISRGELNRLDPGTRSWLVRHDRQWYEANSPAPKLSRKRTTTFINWEQRDDETLERLRAIYRELRMPSQRPRRITVSLLGRMLHSSSFLRKRMDKLPKTREFVQSIVETKEQFEARKIEWFAEQLRRNGETVTRSKLRWGLALKQLDSPLVIKAIESAMTSEHEFSGK
ncbi:MAG: TnsD family transposase [Alicyclobacillus macrosporangiidus]|uniref:TnsD family Tn7-like transposition protein n=1 Tax=Alicyclobacillus macrosporangiidus TaxID=392015 RepID=UPI0034E96604|nr:TnsD family transposase [Alicyclobacillus macrosporangiidus]